MKIGKIIEYILFIFSIIFITFIITVLSNKVVRE